MRRKSVRCRYAVLFAPATLLAILTTIVSCKESPPKANQGGLVQTQPIPQKSSVAPAGYRISVFARSTRWTSLKVDAAAVDKAGRFFVTDGSNIFRFEGNEPSIYLTGHQIRAALREGDPPGLSSYPEITSLDVDEEDRLFLYDDRHYSVLVSTGPGRVLMWGRIPSVGMENFLTVAGPDRLLASNRDGILEITPSASKSLYAAETLNYRRAGPVCAVPGGYFFFSSGGEIAGGRTDGSGVSTLLTDNQLKDRRRGLARAPGGAVVFGHGRSLSRLDRTGKRADLPIASGLEGFPPREPIELVPLAVSPRGEILLGIGDMLYLAVLTKGAGSDEASSSAMGITSPASRRVRSYLLSLYLGDAEWRRFIGPERVNWHQPDFSAPVDSRGGLYLMAGILREGRGTVLEVVLYRVENGIAVPYLSQLELRPSPSDGRIVSIDVGPDDRLYLLQERPDVILVSDGPHRIRPLRVLDDSRTSRDPKWLGVISPDRILVSCVDGLLEITPAGERVIYDPSMIVYASSSAFGAASSMAVTPEGYLFGFRGHGGFIGGPTDGTGVGRLRMDELLERAGRSPHEYRSAARTLVTRDPRGGAIAAVGAELYHLDPSARLFDLVPRGSPTPITMTPVLTQDLADRLTGIGMSRDGVLYFVTRDTIYRATEIAPATATAAASFASPGSPGVSKGFATVFAGTGSGLYKSSDGGEHWTSMSPDLSYFSIIVVAVDPKSPETIYAVRPYDRNYSKPGQIRKTTDGGASWVPASDGLGEAEICALAIDPLEPSRIYAGSKDKGIFRSLDGGLSWQAASVGLRSKHVCLLAIDPQNPATLYAGATRSPHNSRDGGVFKSTNHGTSWLQLPNNEDLSGLEALAIDPRDPETLYASHWLGVAKSTDSGIHWDLFGRSRDYPGRIEALAIAPTNPAVIFGGEGRELFKSMDGGGSWNRFDLGLETRAVAAILVDPLNEEVIYVGTLDGLFRSTNGGMTWSAMNQGFATRGVLSLAAEPARGR